MINNDGFGIAVAVDGVELPEIQHNGDTWVAGVPGSLYTLRLFVPKGKPYGGLLYVDNKLSYGSRPQGLDAHLSREDRPNALDKKTDDRDENELPGPYLKGKVIGLFTFAQQSGDDAEAGTGVIEVRYYDNASQVTGSRGASRGSSRGGDLNTVLTEGSGTVRTDNNMQYVQAGLLHVIKIRYASEAWLRANGILK